MCRLTKLLEFQLHFQVQLRHMQYLCSFAALPHHPILGSWVPNETPPPYPHPTTGLGLKVVPRFVNFVPALAYPFCPALLAAFTQPGDHLLAEGCRFSLLP